MYRAKRWHESLRWRAEHRFSKRCVRRCLCFLLKSQAHQFMFRVVTCQSQIWIHKNLREVEVSLRRQQSLIWSKYFFGTRRFVATHTESATAARLWAHDSSLHPISTPISLYFSSELLLDFHHHQWFQKRGLRTPRSLLVVFASMYQQTTVSNLLFFADIWKLGTVLKLTKLDFLRSKPVEQNIDLNFTDKASHKSAHVRISLRQITQTHCIIKFPLEKNSITALLSK